MLAESSHTRKCLFVEILITIGVLTAIHTRANAGPDEGRVDKAGAVSMASAPFAPDDSYECTGDGVYLYEDIDYGGACRKWTADDPELGDDGWHDRASSIKFAGYYAGGRARVTLYEHHSYTGVPTTFTADDPWLGDDAIGNDQADSIRIEIRPFCDLVSEVPKAECEALVAFYNSTFGPYWSNRTGWLANYTPCSWYGVTCSGGHVTQLHLGFNNLTHSLPAQLGNLSRLELLLLEDNHLSGVIPTSLGNLSSLTALDLRWNDLTGSVPAELGNLQNLEFLGLLANQLTGGIPTGIGTLSKLRVLELGGNELTGSIPANLGNLTGLIELDLCHSDLTGGIPPSLGDLRLLKRLCLGDNPLDGGLPETLGNLSRLEELLVANSQLSGSLPQSLKNLTLRYFWFANTHLCEPPDASFQTWLANIPNLQRTNILCVDATATPTPTVTRTPTPIGLAPRLYLPVVLQNYRQPPETCTELVSNGGFESGLEPWGSSGAAGRGPGRTGVWGGWLGGPNDVYGELIQWIYLPAGASPAPWEFWWRAEAAGQQPGDLLRVLIQAPDEEPELLALPATGALNTWRHAVIDLSPYAGKGFFLTFGATTDAGMPATFRVDDVSVQACVRP